MLCFPNGKINIGLQIIRKRSDGYHDLQTVFYPLLVKDVLEIIDDPTAMAIDFSLTGLDVEADSNNNLCVKAYHLLKTDFPGLPGIKMHLHKAIPVAAGLGGGSADAAFTLRLIGKKYNLNLSESTLKKYALQLGSDCPFFIINRPCYAEGRGELLEEITINLLGYKIVVVNPGISVSTAWAFSRIEKKSGNADLKQCISIPVIEWKEKIFNDLELPVFERFPEIKSVKDVLYASGAVYAAMSGSGSSVFGIFKQEEKPVLNFPAHYFCRWQ